MNYVNNKFIVIVFAILVAGNSCSKSTKPTEVNPDVTEMTQGGFPVRLSVVRDGRSSCIGFRTVPDEPLVELFLVRRQRPDEGGDVYLNESWNVPGSTPLSPTKALDYFFQVEDLFKKHFGAAELEKIVSETDSSNRMTIDELKEKMEDPVYGDRLVAINVMQLINEFRGYAKSKP